MKEPRYSKREMRERKKDIERLRRRAVRSWKKDRSPNTAIVMMTFADYSTLLRNHPH